MEVFQPLLVSAIAVALVHVLRHLVKPSKVVRHPPGPWKLPVIGSMHHLVNVLPHRVRSGTSRASTAR
ncbi:unnamed protein product [Miscanthus lutarioriparius]|uniref:Uncharacterized protein n=1 Tax=Miscanthus lutarioriparius TaxID=422564 RepID=A0A811MPQ8_9POAL|nr:unnamed protein product [Miscanthus lutarioriparius]